MPLQRLVPSPRAPAARPGTSASLGGRRSTAPRARPLPALRGLLATVALLSAFCVAASAPAQAYDPEDAAIRQLRKATTFSRTGVHHAVLLALRDLRDPAMKPFLQSLVQAEHLSIQLGAILGLAELAGGGESPVDPWLLTRLRSDQDRADAIRIVLDLQRAGQKEVETLLAAEDLPSVARIVLLAEQRRLGGTPDRAALARLSENADPAIAGLAACLLADLDAAGGGEGSTALRTFAERFQALPQRQRDVVTEELALAARRYEIRSAIQLLSPVATQPDASPAARDAVLSMVLALEPTKGAALWRGSLGKDPAPPARVRAAMPLLAAASSLKPADFADLAQGLDPSQGETELLQSMARAGQAMAACSDQASALVALYDLGHRRSCRYVIAAAEELPDGEAAKVYQHILKASYDEARRNRDLFNDCIDASARLVERAPEVLKELLNAAEDDGPVQEAILMGLANSRSPAAGELASGVRRIGAGRGDSVALVVLSRHADKLSPQDLAQLGRLAGGGGRIDDTLQAQAAWLWLKHAGRLDSAMPRILAGVGGSPADRNEESGGPPGSSAGDSSGNTAGGSRR